MHGAPILIVDEVQMRLMELCSEGPRELSEIARLLGRRREDLMRPLEELRTLGLVAVERRRVERLELTAEGARYVASAMPEEKVAMVLRELGSVRVDELPSRAAELGVELGEEEARVGLMHLARAGAVAVRDGVAVATGGEALERALREALSEVAGGVELEVSEVG